MRIVIAPDKFKGSLTAEQAARAIAAGWLSADPTAQLDLCPMADGGEGTVSALVAATAGRLIERRVTGPLPEMKVTAAFGFLGDTTTAVVEISAAAGLALLNPADFNPLATTTFGAGELLAAAAEMGATRIIVGLGGSATIDLGIGAAQACGLPVLLENGEPVSPTEPLTGADLEKVVFIKHARGGKLDRVQIEVACDVSNPLTGPTGAAAVFGPQKGATPEQVQWFNAQHARIASRTGNDAIAQLPGAGAAGGLGFTLAAFFNAKLRPGIDIVIEATHLESRLLNADLCITGEGALDEQSLSGKTDIGVARLCKRLSIPCIALVGSAAGAASTLDNGITACFSICNAPMPLEYAMSHAESLLTATAANLARFNFSAGRFAR